jgi:hypothetical protein
VIVTAQGMLEHFKEIADYVATKSGFPTSDDAMRKASRRARDPLPVEWFNGRAYARREAVDAWIDRQRGRRRGAQPSRH